jgi:amino acid permease
VKKFPYLTSILLPMADSKDHGVATQTSGYSQGNAKDIEEKQRVGKVSDLDLPNYDHRDAERHGSEAVNLSGVHDQTHRKLKARHIQLIGFVKTVYYMCCFTEEK